MQNYLDSVDSEWFNQRLSWLLVVILAAFAAMFLRLLYLQVVEGRELRRLSEINSIRLQDIDAPRGLIFDRQGRMLVDNRPAFNLHIVPKDAKPLNETLEKLSHFLDESPDELSERIKNAKKLGPYKPILLKEDIGRDTLAAIEVHKYDLPGVVVKVSPRRHYLFHEHAVHLIGYMGEINAEELQSQPYAGYKAGDYIGKFGIEKVNENLLRGKRGGRQVEVNANGQIIRILETVKAEPGQNLYLTIDHDLQMAAERLLAGKAGSIVAVDPNNGEILVMASSPTFDPNLFVVGMSRDNWQSLISNPFRPLENKAIQAVYPPASTYKIVTTIAGLEEGVITPETTFFCPGHYRYGNRTYRCWKRWGHGEVSVLQALAQSCDVFYYQVGEALGVDRLAWYAKASGLGERTGIGLDGEESGLIPTAAWKLKRVGTPWQGGETLSVAIGQGFDLVTPLQMAIFVAAVGNGGFRYKPELVQARQSIEGGKVPMSKPKVVGRLPMSESTMTIVHQGLWQVVNDPKGTAYRSHLQELDFSGKTGTAQVVGRKEEGAEEPGEEALPKDHAWFVAYAPSENPRIAIAVIVEHGEHGSSAAAPIAAELIRAHLGQPLAEPAAPAVKENLQAAKNDGWPKP